MKFSKFVLGATLLLASLASFAQLNLTTPITNRNSNDVGVYNSRSYVYSINVFGGGSTAGGTYSITLYQPAITLPDGRRVAIFGNTTLPPITIGSGATRETVTPSSASGCNQINTNAASQGTCQLTATFTNAHGRGDIITSGDEGWQEAMNDASNNGGGSVYWRIPCGIITLSNASATTTTTCNVPKTFITAGVSVFVTTTITTSASYSLGITSHTTTFMSACTALTAGTDCGQFIPSPVSLAGGTGMGALLVTANATAGAGAARITVWGYTMAQSNF